MNCLTGAKKYTILINIKCMDFVSDNSYIIRLRFNLKV